MFFVLIFVYYVYSDSSTASPDDTVENLKGRNCGKVRVRSGKYGLGLLRVSNVLGKDKGELVVKNSEGDVQGKANTHIPHWWPVQTDELLIQISNQSKS